MYFPCEVALITPKHVPIPLGTLCGPGLYLFADRTVQIVEEDGELCLYDCRKAKKRKVLKYNDMLCADHPMHCVTFDGKQFVIGTSQHCRMSKVCDDLYIPDAAKIEEEKHRDIKKALETIKKQVDVIKSALARGVDTSKLAPEDR